MAELIPLLKAEHLTMRFGGVVANDDITFTLEEMELRCLIGPNGAGKSTFFKMLTGQLTPTSGSDRLSRPADRRQASRIEIARMGIGIKTQVPNVFNGLVVRENIWLAVRRRATPRRRRRGRCGAGDDPASTDHADRIVGDAGAWPAAMGGDRHGAGGRAGSDPARRAGRRHDRRGDRPHRRDHPRDQPDPGAHRRRARHGVHQADRQDRSRCSTRAACWSRTSVDQGLGATSRCATSISARRWRHERAARGRRTCAPATAAFRSCSASTSPSPRVSIVGILGHNGMGKTTLLRTLIGHLPTTGGQRRVRRQGHHRICQPHERARLGIGLCRRGGRSFPTLSVHENLRMGLAAAAGEDRAVIDAVLEEFPRLERLLDRPRRRAVAAASSNCWRLARCLCTEPRLILLDEPTEGIQPSIIEEIIETLLGLKTRWSMSHDRGRAESRLHHAAVRPDPQHPEGTHHRGTRSRQPHGTGSRDRFPPSLRRIRRSAAPAILKCRSQSLCPACPHKKG